MVFETVLGLTGLLALAAMMVPVARRVNFPYTVLLAAVGVFLGIIAGLLGESRNMGVIDDFMRSLQGFGITSEAVLFVFLPALVFESALAIDVRKLFEDLAPILLLAVIGLLISAFIVGLSLSAVSEFSLIPCLLLGAIVSATDPVAVVAIFKDLGAPKRLAILVEGESLFNDATAIVLFTILAAILVQGEDVALVSGALSFLEVFVGGVIVGYLLARLVCAMIARLVDVPLVETTLTISLAYIAFVVAEHYLHVSGVMAVVSAALVLGSHGRTAISPSSWHALTETWEFIGFWANSLIFVLVGMLVPTLLAEAGWQELGWLTVLLLAAFTARALIIYGLLPLLSGASLAQHVSTAYKTVMFWGGLRGAVSLALALAVLESPSYDDDVKNFIGILVTGFVLFTLFINAPTMKPLMGLLGLDRLSVTDLAIRNRAMALSLGNIRDKLAAVSQDQDMEDELANEILGRYQQRIKDAETSMAGFQNLREAEWLRVGLATLINRERKLCLGHFADGFISPTITRQHLAVTDNLVDGLKSGGVAGYRVAVVRSLGFPPRFKLAMYFQRRTGIAGPLSLQLSNRFEMLLAAQSLLRELAGNRLAKMSTLLGDRVLEELEAVLHDRLKATEQALEALRLQYPDYARELQRRHLGRVALRLEGADYRSMYDESLISQEVYNTFAEELITRRKALDERVTLDLGLEPERLVARVPFFNALGSGRIAEIATLLKPRLVVPGEHVVRKGDTGDAMYFISSGTVEVSLDPEARTLGSGSFFGEFALLHEAPRVADVTALTYCQLLALYVKDFHQLLDNNPELRQTIETVAAERLADNVPR